MGFPSGQKVSRHGLTIWSCLEKLTTVPASMKAVRIDDCAKLLSLPYMPSSLERLSLTNCWSLTDLPSVPRWPTHVFFRNCPRVDRKTLPTATSYYLD